LTDEVRRFGVVIADTFATEATNVATGTIKRVVKDKGFGFIRDDRGQEYFFHRSAVDGDFSRLMEGQAVAFEEERSDKGPRAGSVRVQQ
jgi:CspA family cold shock protein